MRGAWGGGAAAARRGGAGGGGTIRSTMKPAAAGADFKKN